MKTPTRTQILKIIEKKGATRPHDLAKNLQITPQALHRHLKSLLNQGKIEQLGSPPSTRYILSGTADFSNAFAWIGAKKITLNPNPVCETRDALSARLSHFISYTKPSLSQNHLSLVTSIVGEVGNNSFDHNLGQWADVPGCWLESQFTGKQLWICIADRGQGVFNSLSQVDSSLKNDQDALEAAFERQISGRAPEQRGNGLKFVRNIITQYPSGIGCQSGKGKVKYGNYGDDCVDVLKKIPSKINGTITLIKWSLS